MRASGFKPWRFSAPSVASNSVAAPLVDTRRIGGYAPKPRRDNNMAIGLIIGSIVVVAIVVAIIRAYELGEARKAYQAALEQLTSHPADNNIRIAALFNPRIRTPLRRSCEEGRR
jgi:hypothetical protein